MMSSGEQMAQQLAQVAAQAQQQLEAVHQAGGAGQPTGTPMQPAAALQQAANVTVPLDDLDAATGPIRSGRGGARGAHPYPRTASQAPKGNVPAAVSAIEHAIGTPMRAPPQACEVDELRRFVEAKFGQVDAQLKILNDAQHEEADGAGKWRARVEQRFTLLDVRITTAEQMAQKAQGDLQNIERFVLGMNVQTLRQELDKFAVDIERAFTTANQADLDIQNHCGTMGEAYQQQNAKIAYAENILQEHARKLEWLNAQAAHQLNQTAERCGACEACFTGLATGMAAGGTGAAASSSGPAPTMVPSGMALMPQGPAGPPGPPGIDLSRAYGSSRCHCACVEHLIGEMAAVKTDIIATRGMYQNLNVGNGGFLDNADARLKILESAISTIAASAGQWQQPAQSDPWSVALGQSPPVPSTRGGRSYGDDPGAGGPGGFPGGDGRPWGGAGRQHDAGGIWNLEKVFDDKVAQSQDSIFDGGNGGEKWRIKVRGYWISKLPALLEVIQWVERQDTKSISKTSLEAERMKGNWKGVLDAGTLDRVNGLVWGFLNLCLKGEAHKTFQLADTLNGFEGWRLIVALIHRGRENRQAELRKLVRNPPAINKLEDVESGITAYDNLIREYIACDGTAPTPTEKKTDLLDMLPLEIRENLLWRATDPNKSYEEFRDHIKGKANHVLYHRGKSRSQVNAVEHPMETPEQVNVNGDDDLENLIAVIQKKINLRRGANGQFSGNFGGPGRAGGATLTELVRRCVNCGSKEHLAAKCPKPAVDSSERPCYKCGKPGHLARQCTKGGGGGGGNRPRVHMVDEEPVDFGGMVVEPPPTADPAWQRTKSRMRPREVTLNDFIAPVQNSFAVLNGDMAVTSDVEVRGGMVLPADELPSETSRPVSTGPEVPAPKCQTDLADKMKLFLSKNQLKGNKKKRGKQASRMVRVAEDEEFNALCEEFTSMLELDVPDECHDDRTIAPVYLQDDDEIFNTETEEKEIDVAVDSGCVAHCVCPEDLPRGAEVKPPPPGTKPFVGAGGDHIKRHGKVLVQTQQEGFGPVNQVVQVADVTRPLHALSQIADTDKEILFTKREAIVVPDGALSKFLKFCKQLAKYRRQGGLYVGKMRIRVPKPKPASPAVFGGQGKAR